MAQQQNRTLEGKRVALLVTNGFEEVELTSPREALAEAGAETRLVSPEDGEIRSWQHTDWGATFRVDETLDEADPASYDALVLPGGVMNPDHLRRDEKVQRFVRHFVEAGKPVASICHGPWTLIDIDAVKGRTMTSYHTLQMDLKNAGATWVDKEVVRDGTFVTSRNPDDLPAFNKAIVKLIATTEPVATTA